MLLAWEEMRVFKVEYKGRGYGHPEIIAENFADMLRAFDFKVVPDWKVDHGTLGDIRFSMEQYCRSKGCDLVVLMIKEIPYYFAIKDELRYKDRLRDVLSFTLVDVFEEV